MSYAHYVTLLNEFSYSRYLSQWLWKMSLLAIFSCMVSAINCILEGSYGGATEKVQLQKNAHRGNFNSLKIQERGHVFKSKYKV